MGQELACRMRFRRRTLTGKAQLETGYVLFRGDERLKIPLKDMTSVSANGGLLKLEFAGGPAEFELGSAAEKWAARILNPPSLLDKLGVKPGVTVRLIGRFEEAFLAELRERQAGFPKGRVPVGLVFFAAQAASQLSQVPKFVPAIQPAGALWIVYPKSIAEIREIEVIEAGRAAGLKDAKVASFSETHTALKFVVPTASR